MGAARRGGGKSGDSLSEFREVVSRRVLAVEEGSVGGEDEEDGARHVGVVQEVCWRRERETRATFNTFVRQSRAD